MAAETDTGLRYAAVTAALASWRQGDCVVGEQWFAYRLDPSLPVAELGGEAVPVETELAEAEVVGLVVVTQTCDIVRSCTERPYIDVSPLVEVDDAVLRDVERGRRPRYGYVPLLADRKLVADLDRTMTIEKPVVAKWNRIPGWTADAEARTFAAALARKRARFAFPDDFSKLVTMLRERLTEKHNKQSREGRALRALREIRVQAAPSWDDPTVSLMFWFVRRDEDVDFLGQDWSTFVQAWLKLVPGGGRFRTVQGQITTLEDMTAADYVGSDALDLDHLSSRAE
ncbi:MAG: hypothetical protein HYU51_01285 [Candidatus Rokubacteria bacterium]|nr:hypothetical protein [Candidatus Rokubacteria bacterium]